ncbi:hypothetical protein B0H16DRAFT_1888574 [Mycena metata]|uniref:Uncharacterized protein n=1 Tax=Mycena metata TaxID=1033252 RepID=A0AAD7IS16_9AGAR|nr:hypothetical protein B0H16DRAFT_1888574 [Mycena metata]
MLTATSGEGPFQENNGANTCHEKRGRRLSESAAPNTKSYEEHGGGEPFRIWILGTSQIRSDGKILRGALWPLSTLEADPRRSLTTAPSPDALTAKLMKASPSATHRLASASPSPKPANMTASTQPHHLLPPRVGLDSNPSSADRHFFPSQPAYRTTARDSLRAESPCTDTASCRYTLCRPPRYHPGGVR